MERFIHYVKYGTRVPFEDYFVWEREREFRTTERSAAQMVGRCRGKKRLSLGDRLRVSRRGLSLFVAPANPIPRTLLRLRQRCRSGSLL